MGKYLDIVRKAVEDYREEQTKRLAAERQEKVLKIEEIVLQRYSDKLKGESGSLDKLINKLELWNPHFTATRDVIEEAVRAAKKRLPEREDHSVAVTESPVHQRAHKAVEEHVEASGADVNRTRVEADSKETYDPESVSGGSPEEQPGGLDLHGDVRSERDQIVRVSEVLRQHPDRLTWDVRDLLNEGFFHDKLDFEPTPLAVEEAQCRILLPE